MFQTESLIKKSSQQISRRCILLGVLQAAVMGGLAFRLHDLQLGHANEYRDLADRNRLDIRLIVPERGRIFDRNGTLLAGNRQNYRILMVREDAGDYHDVMDRLSQVIHLTQEDVAKAIESLENSRSFVPVTVAEDVGWDNVAKVSVNAPALQGVSAEFGYIRTYPFGRDFAHLIGYVGAVSDRDRSRPDDQDPLLQIPGFRIGKSGIEAGMERELRGKAGNRTIEVNAHGRTMREIGRKGSDRGVDVQLAIDQQLQNYVQARLSNEFAATAVAIHVKTGELHAVASTPTFDPNAFVTGISQREFSALQSNEYGPFLSRGVRSSYPPGSTFKMVTGLAGLVERAVGPDETFFCNGSVEVADHRFHCWRRGGHGKVDYLHSLRESCDLYYYKLAERIGIDSMVPVAHKLGLGQSFDIDLPYVSEGLIPTKAWKLRTRSRPWTIGDTLNAAIGQGFVGATALQLAVMTARIASGTEVIPWLVRGTSGFLGTTTFDPLEISPDWLELVRKGMFQVVNDKRGTAYKSRSLDEAFLIAGKTGTSQIRRITKEERARGVVRNEDLPWKRRDHALFCGYGPAENPEFAVAVIVEHGGGGSTAAAPIARDILLRLHYGGLPPLEAYPEEQRELIKEQQDSLELLEPKNPPPAITHV